MSEQGHGTPAEASAETPTAEQIRDALGEVIDPEIGLPITELGLVYDIRVDPEGSVEVIYTLTTLGCPAGPAIDGAINEILAYLPGVSSHKTTIVFQPPWTPEKMSEDAKAAMGML